MRRKACLITFRSTVGWRSVKFGAYFLRRIAAHHSNLVPEGSYAFIL
jgi:hypothetical protein